MVIAPSVDAAEQLSGPHFETSSDIEDRVQRRLALTALDPRDGGLVQTAGPAKPLLSQPALLPDALDVGGKAGLGRVELGQEGSSISASMPVVSARLS